MFILERALLSGTTWRIISGARVLPEAAYLEYVGGGIKSRVYHCRFLVCDSLLAVDLVGKVVEQLLENLAGNENTSTDQHNPLSSEPTNSKMLKVL